jgi:predicted GNAT family acetyltransferase
MAVTPEDSVRHVKESTESHVAIGSPVVVQFYQEEKTDIEHTVVEDDPRKWGNARKVST